ncbi:hypothetical protein OG713_34820 [Streptomyces sp. NBC_00723]|uniref:hypothetical protein n=1 Tax=Streptomyces sp. NBC_00723 TaxID=2903673 RepID=UPI003868FE2F
MKPRKGQPTGSNPYTPDSVKPTASSQHALVRRLGPNGLWNPAFEAIVKAADELAVELGKPVEQFTDEEAGRAIELGKQRHEDGQR